MREALDAILQNSSQQGAQRADKTSVSRANSAKSVLEDDINGELWEWAKEKLTETLITLNKKLKVAEEKINNLKIQQTQFKGASNKMIEKLGNRFEKDKQKLNNEINQLKKKVENLKKKLSDQDNGMLDFWDSSEQYFDEMRDLVKELDQKNNELTKKNNELTKKINKLTKKKIGGAGTYKTFVKN